MDCRKLLKIVCGLTFACFCSAAFATTTTVDDLSNNNRTSFHVSLLYLQPNSNNLKYAVLVSGTQPYYQSWHNQVINPSYSTAFEVGLNYAFQKSTYDLSVDWLHAGTSDSSSQQATTNTDIVTVQFVAPPYDVGPAVFGIKRADSNVKNNFNSVLFDFGKVFEYGSHVKGRVFGGINILNISQNLTTTFSDYAGSPVVPDQAYPLPPDPNFYFTTKNTSNYLGIGPNLGFNVAYDTSSGFGFVGQFLGTLTVGSIHAKDNFTSSSTRLILLGINPSSQSITVPDTTQLVPGFDGKLGVTYNHDWRDLALSIELGYRLAYYLNAISTIAPDTLVQPGLDAAIPEFATGTMAINSTTTSNSPFSLSGPYLTFAVAL